MQLKIHEHLHINQERSLRTFEHFLGHFFGHLMPMSDWRLEVWLIENDQDEESDIFTEVAPKFSCALVLSRPGAESIYIKKMSSNLSGAIYYALKSIHRETIKQIKSEEEKRAS